MERYNYDRDLRLRTVAYLAKNPPRRHETRDACAMRVYSGIKEKFLGVAENNYIAEKRLARNAQLLAGVLLEYASIAGLNAGLVVLRGGAIECDKIIREVRLADAVCDMIDIIFNERT